jgi:hypothetical protein
MMPCRYCGGEAENKCARCKAHICFVCSFLCDGCNEVFCRECVVVVPRMSMVCCPDCAERFP